MRKISVVAILSAGLLAANLFGRELAAQADDAMVNSNDTPVINDEGYGNSDAEYYNSEKNADNTQELSDSADNSTTVQ